MFDLFNNVFGKSKKSNGKSSNDKDDVSLTGERPSTSSSVYPTILLTDQMLKGQSESPPFEIINNESTAPSTTRTTSPFRTSDSVIVSSNSRQKHFSPLDNIPFSMYASSSSDGPVDDQLSDLTDCFNLLNSVASYLANSSSEYKFTMEKTIILNHNLKFL